jgi:hypothetical protein
LAEANAKDAELLARAFEAGVRHERARLTAIINADAPAPQPSVAVSPLAIASPPAVSRRPSGGASANYGKAINAVRNTAILLGMSRFTFAAVLKGVNREAPELGLSEEQIRTAIKQLVNRGEFERIDRGIYQLPSRAAETPPREENPDAGAPGQLSLAAE